MESPAQSRQVNKAISAKTELPTGEAPLLSVCIPVYNGARYLEESLNSVLGQDFAAYELVVVDDRSTDDSVAVIARCKDQRLRTYCNEQRLGLVGNWNRCLELSRGRYVTLFHQDDVMQPHNLKHKVELLECHLKVSMVYSDVKIIGADGRVQMDHWPKSIAPNSDMVASGMDFFVKLISGYNLMCCSSVVCRKECFVQLGTFDPRLSFTADWEMWLRIALYFDVAYLQEPLVHYRLHDSNETYRFKGIHELEEEFRAKRIALDREPERIPNYRALRRRVFQALETRTLWVAAEGQLSPDGKKECRMLAAEMRRSAGIVGIRRILHELRKHIGKIAFLTQRNRRVTPTN
jgi:glycosyltransferase involved in cell wall biosynthesis